MNPFISEFKSRRSPHLKYLAQNGGFGVISYMHKNTKHNWVAIQEYYNQHQGITLQELQKVFRIGNSTIRKAIDTGRLSVSPRRRLNEQQIVSRYLSGESPEDISKDIGASLTGFYRVLKRLKIPLKGWRSRAETFSDDYIKEIQSYYDNNPIGVRSLSKIFKITYSQISRLKKNGKI